MRLLDVVSQSTSAPPGTPADFPIPAPCHFVETLRACPLRLVLADDIVRCATLLAYADGDRLAGCLDLIHAPMQSVWVEWSEATRMAALREVPNLTVRGDASAKRAGLLVQSDPTGRAGHIRTFWSSVGDVAFTGSLITEFDLDKPLREPQGPPAIFAGHPAGIRWDEEPAVDELLNHVRYRWDPAWIQYYRAANLTPEEQAAVWRTALGTTAYDTAMILALFLLLAAKDGVQKRASDLRKLNTARQRVGRAPLLEHVEALLHTNATPIAHAPPSDAERPSAGRPRRIHRVRGHLMRRGNTIVWRSTHLRGSVRQGIVRTRTVALSFH